MPNQVQDKRAEIGINLSVIVQSLLLVATIGFGTKLVNSVDLLSAKVGMLNTHTTVNASNITHNAADIRVLRTDFNQHVNDCRKYELLP